MPIPSCNHSCYESMSACSLCVLRTCHHAAAALEQPCCVTFAMNGGVPLSRSDDDHIVKISVSSAPSNGSCSKCGVDQRAHDLSKATSPRRRTLRLVRSVRTLSRNAKNISEMIALPFTSEEGKRSELGQPLDCCGKARVTRVWPMAVKRPPLYYEASVCRQLRLKSFLIAWTTLHRSLTTILKILRRCGAEATATTTALEDLGNALRNTLRLPRPWNKILACSAASLSTCAAKSTDLSYN